MFALSTSNRRNLHFLKNVQAQDLGSQIVPQLKATIASHNIKEVRVPVITNLYTVSRDAGPTYDSLSSALVSLVAFFIDATSSSNGGGARQRHAQ